MTVTLILAGLVASGVFSLLAVGNAAPIGYEDEDGFHLGKDPRPTPQK